MQRFDIIAIGGGTAGLVTTAGAASLGLKAALIERESLGGDCLWTGCVPSKAMIASAKLAHRMRGAESLGLIGASPAHVFRAVMDRMRAARARVAHHDDPERFRSMGVDVRFGDARVTGPQEVVVDGKRLSAKRIVIATGAHPSVPRIDGLADVPYLTHLNVFDEDELPSRVVIVGGGPIGLEFAQVYSRLGATVTVVEFFDRIAVREEPEASQFLEDTLREEGVSVFTGRRVTKVGIENGETAVTVTDGDGGNQIVFCDRLFIATGRRANTEGLGLEDIGVALEEGAVKTDRNLRSSVPSIWAAGDVAGGPQFTHVADYQAKLVLRNSVFPFASKPNYQKIPSVTFTDPEVASVGLTEDDARSAHGDVVRAYRYGIDDLDRAIVDGHAKGFVKIVTGRRARILGATIVASGAGDLLQPIVMAMHQKLSLPKLAQFVYPYPTMVEGVKRAADAYYREKFAGNTGAWLRRVVRLLA